jgi:ATP-binding cassette subfamily C (CFTR/MRP) protein 1
VELGQQCQALWSSPVILAVGVWELYQQVGWSALTGLAVLVLFFPLAGFLTGKQIKYQALCAAETDKRIILVNEMILGIRVIKYYAWERPFLHEVDAQREKELRYLRMFVLMMSLTFGSLLLVPLVMSVVVFGIYVGTGGNMNPAVVFTTISLINVIRWPFTTLPMALGSMGQALVALQRIQRFLAQPEIDHSERITLDHIGIQMKDAQFTWKPDKGQDKEEEEKGADGGGEGQEGTAKRRSAVLLNDPQHVISSTVDLDGDVDADGVVKQVAPSVPQLTHIDWSVQAGELLLVLGPVGCGKVSCHRLTHKTQTAAPSALSFLLSLPLFHLSPVLPCLPSPLCCAACWVKWIRQLVRPV